MMTSPPLFLSMKSLEIDVKKVLTLLVGVLCVLGCMTLSVQAEAASKVNVKVQVVHATKSGKTVDKRLGKVAKHCKRLGYSGCKLLASEQFAVSPKGKKAVSIAGGRKMTVAVLSKGPKRARLRVQIQGKKGKLVDMTVSGKRNGMMIVAGPNHKGGILVLPIWARY